MLNLPETVALPLKMDEDGTIRVSGTRVTLDTIITSYLQGNSPEIIHECFDVVPLNDVYATIAYYLAHEDEINTYLSQRDAEAERIRKQWEASYTSEHRARLKELKRLADQNRKDQSD